MYCIEKNIINFAFFLNHIFTRYSLTIGHPKVTIRHPWVTMGHLRVTIGHLKVTVVYLRVTMGHFRFNCRLGNNSKKKN